MVSLEDIYTSLPLLLILELGNINESFTVHCTSYGQCMKILHHACQCMVSWCTTSYSLPFDQWMRHWMHYDDFWSFTGRQEFWCNLVLCGWYKCILGSIPQRSALPMISCGLPLRKLGNKMHGTTLYMTHVLEISRIIHAKKPFPIDVSF